MDSLFPVLKDTGASHPKGAPAKSRLPEWLRTGTTHHEAVVRLKSELRRRHLNTVCESARCPNIHECFHRGTATFMILGNVCARGCGFCSVAAASPGKRELLLDPEEPANVARMAAEMRLRYVVLTSVTRDDLADGGSEHFSETIRQLRRLVPESRVEVLVPDFGGNLASVRRVLDAGPNVFNHNVETVPRLYRRVRPQADYRRSLEVLSSAKNHRPDVVTKSGLMVGLGETQDEVEAVLMHLRAVSVDIVTIGQYMQPTRRNLPVAEYVPPARFDVYRRYGLSLGFREVFSGPLVRSSYMADKVWDNL